MTALGVILLSAVPVTVRSAEVTRVVSGWEDGKRADINVTLTWTHDQKQAAIKRELESAASDVQLVKDLLYRQTRDVINARLEMGLGWDIGAHLDFPIVIRDDRRLDFDQTAGSPCAPPTVVAQAGCSTLLRDGILPGVGQAMYGVDAAHGGRAFAAPSSTVFQGPPRSGLESLGFGVSGAIMNQLRDDTKPTWTMGVDAKFDVGTTMRYDAGNPTGNTGVGLGYHQLLASTFVSKRMGVMDPYFGATYMLPVRGGGSPFNAAPVGSQPHANPQSQVGVAVGFEVVAWEKPDQRQRVSLEVRTRGEHRFQGSSHSELWEPLSGAVGCGAAGKPVCRPGMDFDIAGQPSAYPGLTETQPYSTLGGDVGVNVQVGKYARFRGLFGMTAELSHFITFGSSGSDLNGDGRVDFMNANESNPAYRELIDIPGRRFKVEGTRIWNLLIEGSLMF